MSDKRISPQQNKSLHVYARQLAEALNAGGYDVRTTIKVEVDFTEETVKEYMIKPIMKALYPDLTSTTELDPKQVQQVYENLNRLTSEKFAVGVDWPSLDSMINESRIK